ncbi:hypothetical protein FRB96_004566 [Tulasnella sp. 330]|nr:hypothetical protein FRB96_004566 [Tulasnella sp. 330]KAG8885688.1 hypothetical protein FRB97_000131 [Tulasnella sp. 331]KAG8890851.1 hypothetical protein FRB98_004896 [Tulasnella sp. 332]
MPPYAPKPSSPTTTYLPPINAHRRGKKGKVFLGHEALLKLASSVTSQNQKTVDVKVAKAKAEAPMQSQIKRRANSKAADSSRLRDAKARLVQQSHERLKEKRQKYMTTRSVPSQPSAESLQAPSSDRKKVSFG